MDGRREPADTGARHVGQPVEILPLDSAHGLDHVRLHRGYTLCSGICGLCYRGERPYSPLPLDSKAGNFWIWFDGRERVCERKRDAGKEMALNERNLCRHFADIRGGY